MAVLQMLIFFVLSSFLNMQLISSFRGNARSCSVCTRALPEILRNSVIKNSFGIKMVSDQSVKAGKGKKKESKYSKTVLLPVTSFDQRANSAVREPELQKWWIEKNIYDSLSQNNPGELFILHDGPPYANGDLHIGHALNKILKDFINKYQLLRGKKARFVPGWDCHGLPVELKVLQSLKQKEREVLSPIQLRKRAADFAKDTVEKQKESFKRYGVWGDWNHPYMTLQPEYEAAQINVFGKMVTNGHIYRGLKPVYWSPSSKTALAEAELEYPDNHISKSIYVAFKVISLSSSIRFPFSSSSDLHVAIWTTTPWTIPANMAVAVNPSLEYCIVKDTRSAVASAEANDTASGEQPSGTVSVNGQPNGYSTPMGRSYIVAKDLVPAFESKLLIGGTRSKSDAAAEPSTESSPSSGFLEIQATFLGNELAGTTYQHPLYDRVSAVVEGGDYITTESGTGLVHTAPGHGQEDYLTGLKHNLPLFCPVNDVGRFTEEAGERFKGLDVLGEGNTAVIGELRTAGALVKQEDYHHKYPYDWRTKKPTIVRATEQWFASVSRFREEALSAIQKDVQFIPAAGRNRIASMTESRGDWCISRQRAWGLPIPVFYRKDNNEPLMTAETLSHIESVFREHGSDAWWEKEVAELLPEGPLRDQAEEYKKGFDTMDVWFDSGTSWAGRCLG